jgi:hypothetical protein
MQDSLIQMSCSGKFDPKGRRNGITGSLFHSANPAPPEG